MIPGTIEEWKKALASSKPGSERATCVQALLHMGAQMQWKDPCVGVFTDAPHNPDGKSWEWRVKPTPRPWNAEDARRHVGFAWRLKHAHSPVIIICPHHVNQSDWSASEYATPIPGTDPSTWNWQKCEVVE